MSTEGVNLDVLIERYLDDALSPAERAAFEQRLRTDAQLQQHLALQTRINDSLRRLFAPPAAMPHLAAPAISIQPRSRSMRPLVLLAAAASILLGGFGIWKFLIPAPATTPAPAPFVAVKPTLRGHYRSEVFLGMEPMEVCTTPEAFEEWVNKNYQMPLRPTETPDGVRFVGWSYANLISTYTGILLAFVDEQPVIVVMDRAEKQAAPPPPGEGDEHIFQKQVGELILYEVTPFAEPRILPLLAKPDAPTG